VRSAGSRSSASADWQITRTLLKSRAESIEFVALADQLRTEFAERVNFVAFLAKKHVDDMVALTVGDVVRYVATSLQDHEPMRGAAAHD
jgi:hypothetical protein